MFCLHPNDFVRYDFAQVAMDGNNMEIRVSAFKSQSRTIFFTYKGIEDEGYWPKRCCSQYRLCLKHLNLIFFSVFLLTLAAATINKKYTKATKILFLFYLYEYILSKRIQKGCTNLTKDLSFDFWHWKCFLACHRVVSSFLIVPLLPRK